MSGDAVGFFLFATFFVVICIICVKLCDGCCRSNPTPVYSAPIVVVSQSHQPPGSSRATTIINQNSRPPGSPYSGSGFNVTGTNAGYTPIQYPPQTSPYPQFSPYPPQQAYPQQMPLPSNMPYPAPSPYSAPYPPQIGSNQPQIGSNQPQIGSNVQQPSAPQASAPYPMDLPPNYDDAITNFSNEPKKL